MKIFYNIDTRGCIQNTSCGPNKLERYITLGWKRPTRKKHSSLMGALLSNEEIKCCESDPEPILKKISVINYLQEYIKLELES